MSLAAAGPSGWAIVGVLTGGVALLWNIWRSVREGPRVHVAFFVQSVNNPEGTTPLATIEIANAGTLPAYVSTVAVTEALSWSIRWPVVGRLSFRARRRWPLRLFFSRSLAWYWYVKTDPELIGRLEPGEVKQAYLADVVNDKRVPMTDEKVERMVERCRWAYVATGLRQHAVRVSTIVANRLRRRRALSEATRTRRGPGPSPGAVVGRT